MSKTQYESMLEKVKEAFPDSCFIGYDVYAELHDLGFMDIPSPERIKDIIKFYNL